tara:strand:- start:917 stop:1456 length:540 start_codon:yes stop_codon:yes gene_type:complete
MKHDQGITAQGAEICGLQADHGIIKVEQSCASRALPTAKADLADGISRADGNIEHLNRSGDGRGTPETWVGKESALMKDEYKASAQRVVEIDTAKYQKYLDDPALGEDQKHEIVEAIWGIMMNFVSLGFEVHPVQQAMNEEACGQLSDALDPSPDADSNGAKQDYSSLTDTFNAASDDT